MARWGRRGEDENDAQSAAAIDSEPMVNRTLELELLKEHVARVAQGGLGHAVLLLGESGVGKSRLSQAAAAEARRLEMTVILAHCLGRGAEPLLPIRDGLATYLGRSQKRIRRTLLGAAPRLLDAIPFIGAFLGRIGESIVESRQLRGATPEGVYEELSRILLGISDKQGLLLVVEDLHQADQDTLFFINYLLHKIRGRKLLTIFTIQEEQLPDAPQLADLVARWTAEGYAILTVVPLERAHVGEYVQMVAALGSVADEELVDRLFRLTGGNPFFLKETLALLAIRPPTPGSTKEGESEEIPPRAEAVLRRRLARADTTTHRFLDAAAVVAETSQEIEPIAHVMEAELGTAIRALSAAVELRLMREGPNGEISFVHSLMQRAVYSEIGANYRRFLHSRAADWFERAGQLTAAVFHFERAERTADMVRTALQAAERAEQTGMYHSALLLYHKVRPHVALEEIGPLLGNAMITLGNWGQAQELVDQLPPDDGRVRLLRSQLKFVRGDFRGAHEEVSAALDASGVDRIEVLIRLADIELYLGRFPDAERYVREASVKAEQSGSIPQRARCLGELGAIAFFSGGITRGDTLFTQALALITEMPDDERDVSLQTVLLGNLGNVAEARGDWAGAQRLHGEALRLRRETADARGALHSLHALGRCRIALGDREGGFGLFVQAERLAVDLGETLERAKISHSRAELALRDGDGHAAYQLATAAYDATASQTHYDITHAQVTLSAAAAANGRERESVERGAVARMSVQARGYGLLRHLYPVVAYLLADRIAGAVTAYACGDALGLPWENFPPVGASTAEIEALPAREGWERGATSDDTALTLLVAQHLAERGGAADAPGFLRMLAAAAGSIHGIGPSTTGAIEHFRATGEPPASGGTTNGAPMRALPIGWATPLDDPDRRRRLALELTRATHPASDALVAACVVAACASWALEGASGGLLLDVAIDEEAQARSTCGASDRLGVMLASLNAETWQPPTQGVSLDPAETVTAALACTVRASSLRDGLLQAVRMGGDTDTVAAITGGLLGSRVTATDVFAELPWHVAVRLPDSVLVAQTSAQLAVVRSAAN